MKSLVCLLAVCSVVLATTREEYCDTCPGEHTMCIYDGVSEACDADGASGVSDSEKSQIVDLHNQLRNKIASGEEDRGNPGPQPSASNMKKMTWDDGIAEVAQRWADQCNYGHDACRKDPRFPDVWNQIGQNAAYDTSCDKEADWNMAVNLWYDEVEKFDNSDVKFYSGRTHSRQPECGYQIQCLYNSGRTTLPASFIRFLGNIGHYSQVVWADTDKVGCGFRTYTKNGECRRYYVCNYGPTGNFPGATVYEEGEPRSSCPDAPQDSNYPALC